MSEHTKEPWKVFRSTNGLHVLGIGDKDAGGITDPDGGLWRSDPERAANAARIVSCVNAMAGIPDPAAYVAAFDAMVEALRAFSLIADMESETPVAASVMVNVERCRDARAALQAAHIARGDA